MNSLSGFCGAEAITYSLYFGNHITRRDECMCIGGRCCISNRIRAEPLVGDVFITIRNTNLESNLTIYTDSGIGNCNFRNRVGIYINGERIAFHATTIVARNKCCVGVRTIGEIFSLCISITSQSSSSSCYTILFPSNLRINTRIVVGNGGRQLNLSSSSVIIASILCAGNRNRIRRNDIDCVINGCITAGAFLREAYTIDKLLNVRTCCFRSIIKDRLVSLVVGKDLSVTSPHIRTVAARGNVSLKCVFKAIANCIFSGRLSDSNHGFANHFDRIGTRSRAVCILLTDADEILIVSHRCRSNSQSTVVLSIKNSCIAFNLVPLVSDVSRREVANVSRKRNIATSTDAILIMCDLCIDGVIHIDIEGIRFNGAAGAVSHNSLVNVRICTAVSCFFIIGSIDRHIRIVFIPSIFNRRIASFHIDCQTNRILKTDKRGTSNVYLRSGLNIQSIVLGDRLTTTTGLCGFHAIDNLFNVTAVVHRIIREGCVRNAIQNFTVSIPSVGVFFIVNTGSGGNTNRNCLAIANRVRQSNCNHDFRNCRNFDGSGIKACTISTVGTIAFYLGNHLVVTGGSKVIMEVGRGCARYFSIVNIPLIGNIAGVVGHDSFEIHRAIQTDCGIAKDSFNNRCTIYIYGEVHAFSRTTVTTVNFHRIEIRTFGSYDRLGKGVGRTCLYHATIEVPSICGRRSIGSGKDTAISGYFTLQRNFIGIGIAEEL